MTKSNSIQSFPHCKRIFDEAYASTADAIVVMHSENGRSMTVQEQNTLVTDLIRYRYLVRKENSKFYPEGHPDHMTSIFDPFIISKTTIKGHLYVKLRRRRPDQFKILPEDLV